MRYRGLVLTLFVLAGLGSGLHAQTVDVEVDPITCWWRASTGFIRIGEPFSIVLTCAVVLTLQEYIGGSDRYAYYFPYDGSKYWELKGFVWWSGWLVLGYVLIPMAVIIAMPGERLRDYNLSFRNFPKHVLLYLAMFIVFLPVVIAASRSSSFRHTYPFYRMANRSHFDLWMWQALYAAQFISLEFFFRGFLLQGLRRALGANAIFVMIMTVSSFASETACF